MAKILIVDDEPRIRELIREHLQYAGYVCEEAGDGSSALSLLSGGGYDLVILDVMMPFMDGMTCLREMRARHINTPVIILTARGEEYDKLAGLEGGADDDHQRRPGGAGGGYLLVSFITILFNILLYKNQRLWQNLLKNLRTLPSRAM